MPHSAVVAKDVLVGVPYVWAHTAPANTGPEDLAVASAPLHCPQCEVARYRPPVAGLGPSVAPVLAPVAAGLGPSVAPGFGP